jgi:aspartate 1-decarboxylase
MKLIHNSIQSTIEIICGIAYIHKRNLQIGRIMYKEMLLAKIHRATVTASDLNYIGSITIDKMFMDKVDILEWEKVQVVDINNGNRFETYVIAGDAGSKTIQLNGAAARLVQCGDKIIIMSYGYLSQDEVLTHQPKVLILGDDNRMAS